MADPFSLATGVISLVVVTVQIIKGVSKMLDKTIAAHQAADKELERLQGNLEELQRHMESNHGRLKSLASDTKDRGFKKLLQSDDGKAAVVTLCQALKETHSTLERLTDQIESEEATLTLPSKKRSLAFVRAVLKYNLSPQTVDEMISNLKEMQTEIQGCLRNLETSFNGVNFFYDLFHRRVGGGSGCSLLSTSTTLTARLQLVSWLEHMGGRGRFSNRSGNESGELHTFLQADQDEDKSYGAAAAEQSSTHSDDDLGDHDSSSSSRPRTVNLLKLLGGMSTTRTLLPSQAFKASKNLPVLAEEQPPSPRYRGILLPSGPISPAPEQGGPITGIRFDTNGTPYSPPPPTRAPLTDTSTMVHHNWSSEPWTVDSASIGNISPPHRGILLPSGPSSPPPEQGGPITGIRFDTNGTPYSPPPPTRAPLRAMSTIVHHNLSSEPGTVDSASIGSLSPQHQGVLLSSGPSSPVPEQRGPMLQFTGIHFDMNGTPYSTLLPSSAPATPGLPAVPQLPDTTFWSGYSSRNHGQSDQFPCSDDSPRIPPRILPLPVVHPPWEPPA